LGWVWGRKAVEMGKIVTVPKTGGKGMVLSCRGRGGGNRNGRARFGGQKNHHEKNVASLLWGQELKNGGHCEKTKCCLTRTLGEIPN